jgi:hypothetical protein
LPAIVEALAQDQAQGELGSDVEPNSPPPPPPAAPIPTSQNVIESNEQWLQRMKGTSHE